VSEHGDLASLAAFGGDEDDLLRSLLAEDAVATSVVSTSGGTGSVPGTSKCVTSTGWDGLHDSDSELEDIGSKAVEARRRAAASAEDRAERARRAEAAAADAEGALEGLALLESEERRMALLANERRKEREQLFDRVLTSLGGPRAEGARARAAAVDRVCALRCTWRRHTLPCGNHVHGVPVNRRFRSSARIAP
jgi:hypothetical protein